MKTENLGDGQVYYFIDKCLPFGSSISCSHFQHFSDSLAHIWCYRITQQGINLALYPLVTNYLDDFLFMERSEAICNQLLRGFLDMCKILSVPLALDKTEWANKQVIFLGILMDGETHTLVVPEEKRHNALTLLWNMIDRKKATVKQIQSLAGLLNFLCKAVFPGRAFTRRMYAKYGGLTDNRGSVKMGSQAKLLKAHHHVNVDREFRSDCKMWVDFLHMSHTVVGRPFVDTSQQIQAKDIGFYSDAAKNRSLGFGGVFSKKWLLGKWGQEFMDLEPSIEYLELFDLCISV